MTPRAATSRLRLSLGALGLVVTAAACGSTAAADLFAGASDGGAGAVVDAGAGSDSGGTSDGGPSASDGGKRDASASDAGKVDAAPAGEPLGCSPKSGVTCNLQTELCCRSAGGYACQSPQASCNGMEIPCAEARDCAALGQPGTLCCASYNQQNRVDGVSCMPVSDCVFDQGFVVVCDPSESDPCPNGGKCTLSSVTFPGFYLCIP